MNVILSDTEIDSLIHETKLISNPDSWKRMKLRSKRGHYEFQSVVIGESQNEFSLIYRKSMNNQLDFSVILAIKLRSTGRLFRLRRYNGCSHEHTNRIERETFYDFHIHYATERYQNLGMSEDAYAVRTDCYSDDVQAFNFAVSDSRIVVPNGFQLKLFV